MFKQLSDLGTLAAPLIKNEENPEGMTFLVWECPGCNVACATDTFIYDKAGKISKQNVVVWPAGEAKPVDVPQSTFGSFGSELVETRGSERALFDSEL